jgi:hypothetical protein
VGDDPWGQVKNFFHITLLGDWNALCGTSDDEQILNTTHHINIKTALLWLHLVSAARHIGLTMYDIVPQHYAELDRAKTQLDSFTQRWRHFIHLHCAMLITCCRSISECYIDCVETLLQLSIKEYNC